jgi:copper chaperone CopZ
MSSSTIALPRQALSIGIEGMTCSSCAARVEKVLGRLPGISRATVSFSTESALLESDSVVDLATVRQAIEKAGFHVPEEDRVTGDHGDDVQQLRRASGEGSERRSRCRECHRQPRHRTGACHADPRRTYRCLDRGRPEGRLRRGMGDGRFSGRNQHQFAMVPNGGLSRLRRPCPFRS